MAIRDPRFSRTLCLAAASLACFGARAQVERSGGNESQRIIAQYQQVAAEKTALAAQLEQMKKDLAAAQGELASTRKERDALKARVGASAAFAGEVAQLTASRDAAEKNLGAYKQRIEELIGRYRDLAAKLKDVETDRSNRARDLTERNAAFDKCAENNAQLYDITSEVLDRYEHVGLFTKASATEPFTRITRTRIENLADEYRQRAQENRTKKQTPPTPPPAPRGSG
jgi:chromosome segregation ATPase